MKNMDKELKVPKWVLVNWPKIPKIVQAEKFGISMKNASLGVCSLCLRRTFFRMEKHILNAYRFYSLNPPFLVGLHVF